MSMLNFCYIINNLKVKTLVKIFKYQVSCGLVALGMAMGRAEAEGWHLHPHLTWACPRCPSSFFFLFLFLSSWTLPPLLFFFFLIY